MKPSTKTQGLFVRVYAIVARIPAGRVMTYGQISEIMGRRLSARAVGWAMRSCPDGLPWHRVVNASGRCSTDELADGHVGLQRALLEAEGVVFKANGALNLDALRYLPKGAARKLDKSRT